MAAPAEGALREVIFYLTGGVLAASLVLGGGTRSGFLGDVVLQLLSIPLLWAVLRELITSGAYQCLKWPLAFAATIALVPAAQLIPLPTPIWRLLPGREVLSETYRLLGPSQPLLPLTMSPTATWLSGRGRGMGGGGEGSAKFTIGLAAVAITVSMQFALYRILERFGPDALSDARVPFARNRIAAAKAYMPFGSGLGTFVPVYQMFEKPSDVAVAYANHAHNDLLEVWLETGLRRSISIERVSAVVCTSGLLAWRGTNLRIGDFDRGLVRAALVVIALLFAHSLVDYPLRTNAMMAVAAFAIALLVPPVERPGPDGVLGEEVKEFRRRRRTGSSPFAGQTTQHGDAASEVRERSKGPFSPPREAWGQSVEWPEPWREPTPSNTKKI